MQERPKKPKGQKRPPTTKNKNLKSNHSYMKIKRLGFTREESFIDKKKEAYLTFSVGRPFPLELSPTVLVADPGQSAVLLVGNLGNYIRIIR